MRRGRPVVLLTKIRHRHYRITGFQDLATREHIAYYLTDIFQTDRQVIPFRFLTILYGRKTARISLAIATNFRFSFSETKAFQASTMKALSNF